MKFIELNQEVQELIIWADNCNAQNKSWYTILAHLVNSNNLNLINVTKNYFEIGL